MWFHKSFRNINRVSPQDMGLKNDVNVIVRVVVKNVISSSR